MGLTGGNLLWSRGGILKRFSSARRGMGGKLGGFEGVGVTKLLNRPPMKEPAMVIMVDHF